MGLGRQNNDRRGETALEVGGTASGPLDRQLCQVGGLNQNYTSCAGTRYHIQIEDRGPLIDRLSEQSVRRVNVVVYANYGDSGERIVYGRDHDYQDLRTAEHNDFVKTQIQAQAAAARQVIEEREQRQLKRIKGLFRRYHNSKEPRYKQELDGLNALFPFLVSRAWGELKQEHELQTGSMPAVRPEQLERSAEAELASEVAEPAEAANPELADRVYPLDPELRATVIEIERMIQEVGQDLQRLKQAGSADDILLQTYRKLVSRAEESLNGRLPSQFNVRRLELTRQSLLTTWRHVKARLKGGR